ncbi:NAD(P)/FAD-dependent oxidoreductase [Bradyrhizobium sp.]|uniref:dihydrolipoyl dehydrogenase family protein n=1 Tax=Bradyrhizobium sp. TaxID=376 RepID=UPI0023848F64|nr:FAD-dependent oxidoreductase [Bradyrhizobium sp.]MDE1933538.1 FAD-dependent oxidoreductase [Bradyrhizobium sp.]
MTASAFDVCVIGGGAAGLSVAAGTSQLRLKTVLIERGAMGGECLNSGCIPSKALLAAGKAAHHRDVADIPGVSGGSAQVDFAAVKDGLRAVIAAIAPHDSVARFEQLGVTVLQDSARFVDSHSIEVGGATLRARWFVVATGSKPVVPKIPGLDPSKVLTNETIFKLRDKPDHLVIVGGGPIGVELAIAHRRLGIAVTVLERYSILPQDEPELVEQLRDVLRREGITFWEHVEIVSIDHPPEGVVVRIRKDGLIHAVSGSHLLAAAGRQPVFEDLRLDAAGIAHSGRGIAVDARLRTSRRHIFALGDVIDAPHFTHIAGYQAGIVVRNLAFRLPAKVDYQALPWVTYADPELAHVGLTEAEARKHYGGKVQIQHVILKRNDRAVAERHFEGAIKIVLSSRDKIIGASILAPSAGEMIGLWCLAVRKKLSLRAITDLMLPYPTLGEIGKTAASQHYQSILFSDKTRRLVRALQWLPSW